MNDDELIYQSLNNSKTKRTDILCQILNYISLIPTLVYNTVWYMYLSNLLKEINED